MYKFNFTTITPLHISNGEVLDQNFHYTAYRGDVYKIDHLKFAKLIAKKEKVDFSSDITTKVIEGWVKKYQLTIIDDAVSYSVKIHETFQAHLDNQRAIGRRQIIEFINSNGNFYIPASSIKGALLTPLGLNSLGINPADPKIGDRVVYYDSETIPSEHFSVYRTENRPPENNLICLDPGVNFSLTMQKKGKFDKDVFFQKLRPYTDTQLENLNREVAKFKSQRAGKLRKADLFLRAIEEINTLAAKGEILINIGYGGGSWFKIFEGKIPIFKSKIPQKRNIEEAAHSSFSFTINRELVHIGWCKLEIEEL
jgi:CRISPR/Cas system CSM-associated protein Csm5 (group 7 of RAMP superfamily)